MNEFSAAAGAPAQEYYDEDTATLGDRLAAARQTAGLTQADLAARIGVSPDQVHDWENDRTEPRANRIAILAGLLGVSVTWLLTGVGDGVPGPDASGAFTRGWDAGAETARAFRIRMVADDLTEARRFWADALGMTVQGVDEDGLRVDFFGHTVIVVRRGDADVPAWREDGEDAPAASGPHFELSLPWEEWIGLVQRLRANNAAPFSEEPSVANLGAVDESGRFTVACPGGLQLTFISSKQPDQAASRAE